MIMLMLKRDFYDNVLNDSDDNLDAQLTDVEYWIYNKRVKTNY